MLVVSMSKQEFDRLEVLLRVQSGRLRVADACVLIGLRRRQVFRPLRDLKQDGATSLLSKHRGKPSNRRLPAEVRALALSIVRERYPDFGPIMAAEKQKTSCSRLGFLSNGGWWHDCWVWAVFYRARHLWRRLLPIVGQQFLARDGRRRHDQGYARRRKLPSPVACLSHPDTAACCCLAACQPRSYSASSGVPFLKGQLSNMPAQTLDRSAARMQLQKASVPNS
jgi:hypothetical protein